MYCEIHKGFCNCDKNKLVNLSTVRYYYDLFNKRYGCLYVIASI